MNINKSLKQIFYLNRNNYIQEYKERKANALWIMNTPITFHDRDKVFETNCFYYRTQKITELLKDIDYKISQIDQVVDFVTPYAIDMLNKSRIVKELEDSFALEKEYIAKNYIEYLIDDPNRIDFSVGTDVLVEYMLSIKDGYFNVPDTPEKLRTMFDESMAKIVDEDAILDGKLFRANPVYIANSQGESNEDRLIEQLDEILRLDKDYSEVLHPLELIAIFHLLFEVIHPFYDGNGRMGRLLASAQLVNSGYSYAAFTFSQAIFRNPKSYYANFHKVNRQVYNGDITSFVEYFLNVIELSLNISHGA